MGPVSSNGNVSRNTGCLSSIRSFIRRIFTRRTDLPLTNNPDCRFELPILKSQCIVLMHILKHEEDGICRCPGLMGSHHSFTIPDEPELEQDIEKWCAEVK